MFLHIGLLHLFFNAYALYVIGTELEQLFGWARFLIVYLLSGLFGGLASYAFSANLTAGASGAIFGLIGALATFYYLYRERLGERGRRRLMNIAFLIVINLFLGFTQPGIDNLAHLGGLLSGVGLGWALAPRYEVALQPTGLELVDRNRLARYWPAPILAVALLVGGTALTTSLRRDSPQSHLLQGQLAVEQEDWAAAASELELALGQDPSLAEASIYFYLGLAHNQLGDLEQAAAAYESALELDPEHEPSHWNLGLTYLQLEQYEQAEEHFEAYLALNPQEASDVQPYLDEARRGQ
jgi:rhomboid protease GluP